MIDQVPMEDRDTKGDLYEYMLGKIASAGQNGQFRTPRHIIRLMVEMVAPHAHGHHLRSRLRHLRLSGGRRRISARAPSRRSSATPSCRQHFHHDLFHGFDFDNTMLRIGSMNMLLHGVENPDIRYRDSLAQDHAGEEEKYTLVLANPPFAGSLDYENCAKDLQQIVKTKKTELLFLALFLRLLKPGGRAAVIVPDGVLFGSSNAHKTLRKILVEEQKLDAVISLPGGVFKPYAGVSTAILALHQDQLRRHGPRLVLRRGRRRHVARRQTHANSCRRKSSAQCPRPRSPPTTTRRTICPTSSPAGQQRDGEPSARRPRTAQSFCVPKADIAAQGYDLSLNRYKEVVHEEVAHRPPGEILKALGQLEAEIQQGMKELEGMLK